MEERHIPLEQLHISKLNMRYGKKNPDVSDILPSIREKGILLPLIVRPEEGSFGVVAGGRRYRCGEILKEERGEFAPPRCVVMAEGDDAEALEVSLIENFARRDPDPFSEYETFAKLIKCGRTVDGIAATFGIAPQMVKQRLALANLLPKIKEAYRAEEIDDETVQHLTMASKTQQKEWLALFESEDGNAPRGHYLKQWLFGGMSISTKAAIFPLDTYKGDIVSDLFGDDSYFADPDFFWQCQSAAIEIRVDAYREAGWSDVVALETGHLFSTWEHEKTPKKKGGKVFVTVSHRGDVTFHEGWLTKKEAKNAARANAQTAGERGDDVAQKLSAAKPQMTQAMENYLELHRHAVVRLALLRDPAIAFRLMVAHALAPTGNWNVKTDPQRARSNEIGASVAKSAAQAKFNAEREFVEALLGKALGRDTVTIFAHLLTLTDDKVMRIAAFIMSDTLAVGDTPVEAVGQHLKINAGEVWQVDETFFDLVRDRTTVNAMLAEVAGKSIAKANTVEKAKAQKKIIRDCLLGENWRSKVEGWLPGWMQFPFKPYGKGASRIADAAKQAAKAITGV